MRTTWARAALETRHGTIATDWSLDGDGRLNLQLEVPEGVEAQVRLPGGTEKVVGAGRHEFVESS
jgi:alpha-L-rhamnosidase